MINSGWPGDDSDLDEIWSALKDSTDDMLRIAGKDGPGPTLVAKHRMLKAVWSGESSREMALQAVGSHNIRSHVCIYSLG